MCVNGLFYGHSNNIYYYIVIIYIIAMSKGELFEIEA